MSTSYLIPGISYKEVLEAISTDRKFEVTDSGRFRPTGYVWYDIKLLRNVWAAEDQEPEPEPEPEGPIEVDDIFNIDRHGEVANAGHDRCSRLYRWYDSVGIVGSADARHAWFYGYAGSQYVIEAILDILGDDYFSLTEHDELYSDYLSNEMAHRAGWRRRTR